MRKHLVKARFLDVEDFTFERQDRIACVRRSRPILQLPPALSPSTMKISLSAGSFSAQSASLPGSVFELSAPLRTISRALRAASRGARGFDGFADDVLGDRRILLEVGRELVVEE